MALFAFSSYNYSLRGVSVTTNATGELVVWVILYLVGFNHKTEPCLLELEFAGLDNSQETLLGKL